MLVNIQTENQNITYTVCLVQARYGLIFAGLENCFCVAMSYDCHVANFHMQKYMVNINPPLLYPVGSLLPAH
jgi:hypothetical protein